LCLVYFAEKADGIDGDWWHKLCFKCNEPKCRKALEPGNYSDHAGKLFCKRCYATQVKLQGYGYGNSLDSYRVKPIPQKKILIFKRKVEALVVLMEKLFNNC
jgi:hypothetical protein